jgi:hypothetical protein
VGIQEIRKTNIIADNVRDNVAIRLMARKLRRIRVAVNRAKSTICTGTGVVRSAPDPSQCRGCNRVVQTNQ